MPDKIRIPRLEVHASHACNLTCESCSHYSNHGHTGFLSVKDARGWFRAWGERIEPDIFAILGGEPTLNPELTEIVEAAVEHFPTVEVVSNGYFLHRHPLLGAALKGAKKLGSIALSEHHDDPEYRKNFELSLAYARNWAKFYGIRVQAWRFGDAVRWTRRYHGYGPNMRPFTDGDPRASWEHCNARTCLQLHQGRIWKCPTVAYLPMQVERFPELWDAWKPDLLLPEGINFFATDQQLRGFFGREDEAICGVCPARPEEFHTASPLIPARELLRRQAQS